MQFSRLRLSGFKSFVDPTELPIQPGLTGVVGPNGCGKSNLLEALRWVMGENRPTAMRGSGMEDVIFNGSGRRPPKANAEVVLGVDNSDRTAPAGFNDADILDVSRKLTRDLGSSYKINGKEVRARDVQMLFADASTGAHSPALVRQGQISELIAAKPRARRRVLEEAAGIAGLYQRRHEAELRLNATETNLSRVADTLEQLAAQLVVLQRQARQAARYREIAGQLRRAEGLFLLRRWSEAEAAKSEALAKLAEAVRATVGATRTSEEASEIRGEAEALLPARRDESAIAGALVARVEAEREQLVREEERAQSATRDLMAQMSRVTQDAEREAQLAGDAHGTLERLSAEAEALSEATGGEEEALSEAREAAEEATTLLAQLEAGLAEATEAVAALAARREAAEAALAAARSDWARAQGFRDAAMREAGEAEARLAEGLEASEAASEEHEAAQALLESAEETVAEIEAARAGAQEREAAAREALARARGAEQALSAEAAAIGRMLSQQASSGEGVAAQIAVEPGYERALGAALAEDLRLPLAESGSGWRRLAPLDAAQWPAGVEPLAAQVSAPEALARRLSQIGVAAPELAARLQGALAPGQRLVSPAGDLWRWDGAMIAAGDAPSAAALRFEQQNRLAALQEALAEAQDGRAEAEAAHAGEAGRLARLAEAERTAREARRHAERRVSEAGQLASRSAAAADQARIRLEAARAARERALAGFEQAGRRLAEVEERQGEAGDLEASREALARQRAGVETGRTELSRRRAGFEALRSEFSARHRRLEETRREIAAWTSRAASAGDRVRELERRAEDLAEALEEAAARPDEIRERGEALAETLAAALARREAATRALDEAEAALRAALETERAAEREAGTRREARAAAEARAEAARAAAEEAVARIADERGQSPNELHQSVGADAETTPEAKLLEDEIARLRRARDSLGAVNLRADEDAKALEEEHGALLIERDDLEQAVAKLRSAIAALNREGRERLLAAFDQVNSNFAALFTHLFGGGEARLVLVESDDPLEAGLEILCQPPGKKLSSLSLLSGGEQTLTALALIFGVFLANPAPICVLDEVDAPLDDANVGRFCDLLDEMTRRTRTRFLTITHNAITMARMDRLFGVTMVEQGVSQLVSVDLRNAEALVA